MKRCVVIALSVCAIAMPAWAGSLRLPAGTTSLVATASAQRASDAFAPLLKNTASWSSSLTHTRVNFELEQETGFRLLDAPDLAAHGVDVTKGWALFEHGQGRYLGVFVSTQEAFDSAVSSWAAVRGLPVRTERQNNGVKKVTWSRTPGSRPAAGYARRGDVAVVLLDAAGRTDALEGALKAWDGAAPIKAPVEGVLFTWSSSWRGAKDLWVGLTPHADGLDASGSARQASGWFRREVARRGWLSVATAEGSKREVPFRLRTTPGPKMVEFVSSVLSSTWREKSLSEVPLSQAKALELLSLKIDAGALKQTSKDGSPDWGRVVSPMARLHLSRPAKTRKFSHFRLETDPAGALLVPSSLKKRDEPATGSSRSMKCEQGNAVAAARLDVAQVSDSLLSVGLLSAMRNDILLGVFGVNAEYGHLLRASRPVTAIACEDAKHGVTFEARWRFALRKR